MKARHLIGAACGRDSVHFQQFVECEKPQSWRNRYAEFLELCAVFTAAKEDFNGGYMNSVRNLVQAEVFSDELDQARELLSAGYTSPAAVIAGTVLETTLRQMCVDRALPVGKLDRMNAELAKAAVYSLLVQKRVTALADIRNNAAHGHPDKFKESDVADMINYIEGFVGEHR